MMIYARKRPAKLGAMEPLKQIIEIMGERMDIMMTKTRVNAKKRIRRVEIGEK